MSREHDGDVRKRTAPLFGRGGDEASPQFSTCLGTAFWPTSVAWALATLRQVQP